MNTRGLEDLRTVAFFSMFALALLAFAVALSRGDVPIVSPQSSAEVGIKEYSPLGLSGGAVIPASCSSSYEHTPGECTAPTFTGTGSGGGSGTSIVINNGETVTLNWSCPAAHNTSSSGQNFTTGGDVAGNKQVAPTQTTVYTVVCNPTGTSANVTVTVSQASLSISASPTRVRSGSATAISWSASNVVANSCTVTGPNFSQTGNSGGPVSTGALTAQSVYTLRCTRTEGGTVSASLTVNLIPSIIETGE